MKTKTKMSLFIENNTNCDFTENFYAVKNFSIMLIMLTLTVGSLKIRQRS